MRFLPNETPSLKLGSSSLHEVSSISPHPDGSVVAACCYGNLHILEWPSLKKLAKAKGVSRARYSPDGATLACTSPRERPFSCSFSDPRRRYFFVSGHSSIRFATSEVHPVWCDAPMPAPLSPWKYS